MKKVLYVIIPLLIAALIVIIALPKIKSNKANTYNELGRQAYNRQAYDSAQVFFAKAVSLKENFVEAIINLAKTNFEMNEFDKAFKNAKLATSIAPALTDPIVISGQVLLHKKNYTEAITAFDKAIGLDSTFAAAYYYRGVAKANLGDLTSSLDDYKKAQELDKNNVEYYQSSLTVRTELDDYAGIIGDYNKIIELDPSNTEILYKRGYFKLNLDDFEGALDDFDAALKLAPDMGKAHYYKGLTLAKSGNLADAKTAFSESVKLGYELHKSYFNLGMAQLRTQQIPKAKLSFQKCIGANENGDKADEARLNLGLVDLIAGNYQAAISAFNKILSSAPTNLDALYNRGVCYGELKEHEKAVADFTTCIENGRKTAEVYFSRGIHYISKSKFNEGCADLKTADSLQYPQAKEMLKIYCN